MDTQCYYLTGMVKKISTSNTARIAIVITIVHAACWLRQNKQEHKVEYERYDQSDTETAEGRGIMADL